MNDDEERVTKRVVYEQCGRIAAMDESFRQRLIDFLKPLYQDLDGVSRMADLERVARIARVLHDPLPRDSFSWELLLHFHGLGEWLRKMGNASRCLLAVGPPLTERDLRLAAQQLSRLEAPESDAERALAAALLIDGAGIRGVTHRIARARREGSSIDEVIAASGQPLSRPLWLDDPLAETLLASREEARRQFVARYREESEALDVDQTLVSDAGRARARRPSPR